MYMLYATRGLYLHACLSDAKPMISTKGPASSIHMATPKPIRSAANPIPNGKTFPNKPAML